MRVGDCIEKTKKNVFDGLIHTLNMCLEQKIPEKIILDTVVELYINMISVVNKHKVVEIFKSMDFAEIYLKEYCDDFRKQNGMLDNEDKDEDEEDGGDE